MVLYPNITIFVIHINISKLRFLPKLLATQKYFVYVIWYPSFALSLKIIKSKNYILSVAMILETSRMHCAFII